MTWTYSGDPATNARDSIRFLIGDTDTNDQLISDEEIAWVNNQVTGSDSSTASLYEVSSRCCITIASKFAREADKRVGDLQISARQKAESYRDQAEYLKGLSAREGNVPTPYAGGISISDKIANDDDSDIYHTWFNSGQFTNLNDGSEKVLADYPGADT
jgi:hypothetical protein